MSAYIVDKKTIDRILSFLYYAPSEFHKPAPFNVLMCEDLDYIGQKMLELNIESVHQRYPSDKTVATMPGNVEFNKKLANGEKYSWTCVKTSATQAFLSLSCLTYQSCEGNCNKKKFYKQLEELEDSLARYIAYKQADVEKAEWG